MIKGLTQLMKHLAICVYYIRKQSNRVKQLNEAAAVFSNTRMGNHTDQE
jgi:hypothetical protein